MIEVCNYPSCNCPIDKTTICVRGLPEPGEIQVADRVRHSKYHRTVKGASIDVYDVLHGFEVTNPADAHAIKKMLMPGKRGVKDAIKDRREAIASLERAIELEGGE